MYSVEITPNPAVSSCWNQESFKELGAAAELPSTLGKIVCDGCVYNPAVGYICTARVETPVTLDRDISRADYPDQPNFRLVRPIELAA